MNKKIEISPLQQLKGWYPYPTIIDGGPTLKQHCVNTLVCSIAKWTRIMQGLLPTTLCPANTTGLGRSTQCRFSAGRPSSALAINHSTLDSAFCWLWCVHRVQADTDPMFVKCWASVGGAGQYPFSPSQYFMLAGPARCFEPKLG